MARLLGEHPIRAWGRLSVHGSDGIIACLGNDEEIDGTRRLLRAAGVGLMLDPITLNLVHELNVRDGLVRLGLPLGVTRSTVESVDGLIEQLSIHGDGMKTLGKRGDRFVFNECWPRSWRHISRG